MSLEIERKYLLKSIKIIDLLQEEGLSLQKNYIEQVYTRIDKDSEVRLRKIGDLFTMTSKTGNGLVREEKEEKVSEKLFKLAKKTAIGDMIKKTRYSFKLQNLPTSIDIFHEKLDKLCILEIEFPNEKLANDYVLPYFFEKEIQKEVTLEKRFKNKSLAVYGSPIFKDDINVEKIFKNIENKNPKYDFLSLLPSGIKSYDGMRIIFFSFYKKILIHKDLYLEKQSCEDLHQFRVNIRKTRSLLQSVDGIFEESIKQRFVNDFKNIAVATNVKRDIDVFKEYLDGLDEIEAEEIFEILDTSHLNEALDMLNSDITKRVLQEWEVVLKDDDFFKGEMANEAYKKIGAISLKKRLKKMKKKLDILDESVKIEYFHSVRIEFKRLRYLAETFGSFFNEKSIENIMQVSKKMQNLFGTLQDRDVGISILKNLENDEHLASNVQIMYAKELLQEIINDEIYALKTEILQGKKNLLKVIKICKKDLKLYN